ncbi:hypothetical protein RB195_021717 [Necator americanus]|uniref:Uncharacterized protein n=1 Tax=Necator americanus TaxID=51031 RepID=A0ABR1ECM6_NECAM
MYLPDILIALQSSPRVLNKDNQNLTLASPSADFRTYSLICTCHFSVTMVARAFRPDAHWRALKGILPPESRNISSLDELEDGPTMQGRDAKMFPDTGTLAIAQVGTDTRPTTALLARRINSGNFAIKDEWKTNARGRQLIENNVFFPERTLFSTDEEREEYRVAEEQISDVTAEAVVIMFRVRRLAIICMSLTRHSSTRHPNWGSSLFTSRSAI